MGFLSIQDVNLVSTEPADVLALTVLGHQQAQCWLELHLYPTKFLFWPVNNYFEYISGDQKTLFKMVNNISPHGGLDIKHLVYMPIGHVVLKIYVPWKSFHVPSQYLYKPCKAYVYCWKNKYMPTLKSHMPCRACNHKSLCALGQDLHAPGMWACLNVEPWNVTMCAVKMSTQTASALCTMLDKWTDRPTESPVNPVDT